MSEKQQRPMLLKVLCYATFLFSGSLTLLGLLGLVWSDGVTDMLPFFQMLAMFKVNLTIIYLVLAIVFGLSSLGALMMYMRKKVGFYIYAAVNGLLLLVALFFITNIQPNFWYYAHLILSTAFIGGYAMNLKHMKKKI